MIHQREIPIRCRHFLDPARDDLQERVLRQGVAVRLHVPVRQCIRGKAVERHF